MVTCRILHSSCSLWLWLTWKQNPAVFKLFSHLSLMIWALVDSFGWKSGITLPALHSCCVGSSLQPWPGGVWTPQSPESVPVVSGTRMLAADHLSSVNWGGPVCPVHPHIHWPEIWGILETESMLACFSTPRTHKLNNDNNKNKTRFQPGQRWMRYNFNQHVNNQMRLFQ